MLRTGGLALVAVALVTAGCIGPAGSGDDGESADVAALEGGSALPDELPVAAPAEDARSLTEPPVLRQGEWWTVQLTSEAVEIETEATIVVAGIEDGRYLIGMPSDDYVPEALLLHIPPLGPVAFGTLGYEAHDVLFEPVGFPMETGQSWSTGWYTGDLDAEVVDADPEAGEATVELLGDNDHMTLSYEAGLGIPASLAIDGYASYEVVDHGYGFEGDVKVPWEHDLVFLNGRIAGAFDPGLEPAPPLESITVEEGYDEAVVALLMGNLFVDGPPGVYRVQAEDPNGETHEGIFAPQPEGEQIDLRPFIVQDPSGTWEMEYEAAGPGVAAVEGVAYQVVELQLG